jgi:hypothetical protein
LDSSPNKNVLWVNPARDIYKLLDDTYTGAPGYLTTYLPHNVGPDCVDERATYNGIVCNDSVVMRRVIFWDMDPFGDFSGQNLKVRRVSGDG